jgi:hypothetical protein
MSTKLINLTDDELNAAFAEHVAKWSRCGDGYGVEDIYCEKTFPYKSHGPTRKHDFIRSMDAVLPWMEKLGWRGTSNRAGSTCAATVEVNHPECDGRSFIAAQDYTHTQTPLPRACVIALLRANGVEVVFE